MTCSRTGRRPPKRVRLVIDSLAFGGDGVGRDADGRVIFASGAAPGDEGEVELEEVKKGYARGRLDRLLKASPSRVEPLCPKFALGCGGCQWQHVSAAAQRAAKEDIVRRALRHVIAPDAIEKIRAPSADYRWRRRARLRFRSGVVGYAERRSHRLIDVDACPQLDERLEAALGCAREILAPFRGGSGDVELLCTRRGDVHVVISGHGVQALAPAAEGLLGRAGIAGVVLRGDTVVTIGAATVDLGDGVAPFAAAADLFAQVSDAGNDLLRELVVAGAGELGGLRVLELYAGSGNFTRDLAGRAARVVAVEDFTRASALAASNVPGVETRALTAENAVAAAAAAGETWDVIVLDPPRAGMEAGMAANLRALGAPRIVYVSCDPATLARDLAALAADGLYQVVSAIPVDLMPQTFHVEIVTVLQRAAR